MFFQGIVVESRDLYECGNVVWAVSLHQFTTLCCKCAAAAC